MLRLLTVLALSAGLQVHATMPGGDQGNGGESYAIQFTTIGQKVAAYLRARGERTVDLDKLDQALRETNVESVHESLFLSRFLPKDAVNFPAEKKIIFNRDAWRTMEPSEKPVLVLHEYLGIMRAENASYQFSRSLLTDFSYTPAPRFRLQDCEGTAEDGRKASLYVLGNIRPVFSDNKWEIINVSNLKVESLSGQASFPHSVQMYKGETTDDLWWYGGALGTNSIGTKAWRISYSFTQSELSLSFNGSGSQRPIKDVFALTCTESVPPVGSYLVCGESSEGYEMTFRASEGALLRQVLSYECKSGDTECRNQAVRTCNRIRNFLLN